MPVVISDLRLILGVSGNEFYQQKIMIVLQKDFSLAFISFLAVCVLTTTVKQHFMCVTNLCEFGKMGLLISLFYLAFYAL